MNTRNRIIDIKSNALNILDMPFSDNLLDKHSRVFTNNGSVAIRDLATYSIALPQTNIKAAAYFDDSSYLSTPHDDLFNFAPPNQSSIMSFYLYLEQGTEAYPTILSHENIGHSGWLLYAKIATNELIFTYSFRDKTGNRNWTLSYPLGVLNNWIFVQMGTYGIQREWLNFGDLKANGISTNIRNFDVFGDNQDQPIVIGARHSGLYKMKGYISNLRIDRGVHLPKERTNYKKLIYIP